MTITARSSAPKPATAHSAPSYLGLEFQRLLSYRYQLMYAARLPRESMLIIGKGDGLVPGVLKAAGTHVTIADINPLLTPDVIADVRTLPFSDRALDASLCCQVLEHLPFDQFKPALSELRRVTRSHLILSLPDSRRHWRLRLEFGTIQLDCQGSIPRWRFRKLAKDLAKIGHHWEIGVRRFPISRVERDIRASGWEVLEMTRVHELPWHTFFYCQAA